MSTFRVLSQIQTPLCSATRSITPSSHDNKSPHQTPVPVPPAPKFVHTPAMHPQRPETHSFIPQARPSRRIPPSTHNPQASSFCDQFQSFHDSAEIWSLVHVVGPAGTDQRAVVFWTIGRQGRALGPVDHRRHHLRSTGGEEGGGSVSPSEIEVLGVARFITRWGGISRGLRSFS